MSEAVKSERLTQLQAILDDLKTSMEQTRVAADHAAEEYRRALAILKPPKDKGKATKATGKRGPRKAFGKGAEPPASPVPAESGAGEPEQVKGGRWRNPGSVVTYATRGEAMEGRA